MTDKKLGGTPVADVLAEVDRAQAEVQHNWSRSADDNELTVLRGLAEAVRTHLGRHSELDITAAESTAAELWDYVDPSDVSEFLSPRQVELLSRWSAEYGQG